MNSTSTDQEQLKQQLTSQLLAILSKDSVLHQAEDLYPYECDGLSAYRKLPMLWKLPVVKPHCSGMPIHTPSRFMNDITEKCLYYQAARNDWSPHKPMSQANVLNRLGIELLQATRSSCCGAVSQHLSAGKEAQEFIKRNIDTWWPFVEQGIEAIVITASGCGLMVKDYAQLMETDSQYADKARRISELAKDISEILRDENLSSIKNSGQTSGRKTTVSFHSPCTLQLGQQLNGVVESILCKLGYQLTQVEDAHLCCGSAGTYSILQAKLSKLLLNNKISALQKNQPDIIATANIGCQMHLSTKADAPVKHWIELVEQAFDQ